MKKLIIAIALISLSWGCSKDEPQEAPKYSPYISKVFDFAPAPGQFVNSAPQWNEGDSKADVLKRCEEALVGAANGGVVSLGGFGGYIVFGFDHTIENIAGKRDFRVLGNAFYADSNPNPQGGNGGNCEPGIIMVSRDVNHNGLPDDEWYEIAGSQYDDPLTQHNYQITYFRPESENPDAPSGDFTAIARYIRWEDNQGYSGYMIKNIYHNQSYFPGWETGDRITFTGTLLPPNGVDESGDGSYWVLYSYGFGYADNALNSEEGSAIDIDWAVDAMGQPALLDGIDFVKVYSGVNQQCGWIGENSTEVCGACDLHLID